MSPTSPPQSDIRGTSAEIPYWWCVTTLNWVLLLIGWRKFSTNQNGISTLILQTSFYRETVGGTVSRNISYFFRLGSQGEAKGPQVSETMMLVDNPAEVWSHDLLVSKPVLLQQSSLASSFVSLNKRYYNCRLIISCFKKFSCYRPTFLTILDI